MAECVSPTPRSSAFTYLSNVHFPSTIRAAFLIDSLETLFSNLSQTTTTILANDNNTINVYAPVYVCVCVHRAPDPSGDHAWVWNGKWSRTTVSGDFGGNFERVFAEMFTDYSRTIAKYRARFVLL